MRITFILRVRPAAVVVLFAVVVAVRSLSAQPRPTITLAAGSASSVLLAPSGKLVVPMIVDMSRAAGANIAALNSNISWGTARLSLDSVVAGNFGALSSQLGNGISSLSVTSAIGTTSTGTIAMMFFTAGAGLGGTRVSVSPIMASNQAGVNMLPSVESRGLDVCVAATAKRGDVTGDSAVNIIDAQQIARYSVGLSVVNPSALVGRGDVTGDGRINIIDAQQIARYSVGLSAAPPIATPVLVAPDVSTVSITAAPPSLFVGQTFQLAGVALDANGSPLSGCGSLVWSSSDTAKASVDAAGVLTAVRAGAVVITATAGGRTALASVSTQVLFQDTFSAQGQTLNVAAWTTEIGPSSYLGRTQLADWVTKNGVGTFVVGANGAEVALNTFNPTGISLYGTHGKTLQTVQPTATSTIVFTARLQLATLQQGIVYGVYFYCPANCATQHDEIDIELVTNVLQPGGQPMVQLNRYANDPFGAGHGGLVNLPAGFDPLAPHDWTIQWSLSRVDYYVDGTLLGSATTFVPQGPMTIAVEAWGPDTQWHAAYSATLQAALTAQSNSRFVAYLRSVLVTSF